MAVLARRHISPDQKVRFVMLCMRSMRSVAKLCRENHIGQSSYYLWRAVFVRGGVECLRRRVCRVPRPTKQCKRTTVTPADRVLFLQRVTAFQNPAVQSCKGLSSKKSELVTLIGTAGFSITEAVALAGIPRSTYYCWRKHLQEHGLTAREQQENKRVRIVDRLDMKESVFKVLHSPRQITVSTEQPGRLPSSRVRWQSPV